MFNQIRDKLGSMISTHISRAQEVYLYEESEFNGDPCITITPSSNEAEYYSNKENIRVYAFTVRAWVSQSVRGDKKAEDVLATLVDDIIDMFDRYYTLGVGSPGNALVIPSGYTMIMTEASPSAWYYVTRENSFRMAEITVRCHIHVDVNLIST